MTAGGSGRGFSIMFLDLQLSDAPSDQVYKAAKQIDPDLNVM
jgi:hypothetical protein